MTVGTRRPGRIGPALPVLAREAARLQVHMEQLLCPQAWQPLLGSFDAVINCVGILRQRPGVRYDAVHHLAPAALAAACAVSGQRLVHVSALGLAGPARSRFLTSKRDGEAALLCSPADWFLVRPSLLDGPGGYGARWLRRVAQWPVQPLPPAACGRIAALDVGELGECLCKLATAPRQALSPAARIVELGGDQALTLAEYLLALRISARLPWRLPVPAWLARAVSHLCDVLHLTPFSFGHWELLQRDNVPQHNRLREWLGRAPRAIGGARSAAPFTPD